MSDDGLVPRSDTANAPTNLERPVVDVVKLLDAIRDSLRASIDPLRFVPHRGESGRAIEDALGQVLSRHLPKRFELSTGIALGVDGTASHQSDILILDALSAPAFLRTGATGIYPADSVLGSIEVSTTLDAAKFLQDVQKVRVLRSLPRGLFRLHWTSAPASFLVAVKGPAKIETAAKWLAAQFAELQEKTIAWQLPGAVLILGDDGSAPGLVCYWYVGAQDYVTFNPEEAHGVCCFEGSNDSLPVFLLLLMSELSRVVRERAKAVAANYLLGPVSRPRGELLDAGEVDIDPEKMFAEVAEAVAMALAYIPDLSSYLEVGILDRLGASMVKVQAD